MLNTHEDASSSGSETSGFTSFETRSSLENLDCYDDSSRGRMHQIRLGKVAGDNEMGEVCKSEVGCITDVISFREDEDDVEEDDSQEDLGHAAHQALQQIDSQDLGEALQQIDSQVTVRLAASGTVGLAAAAAINSSRKRNALYDFETNPSVRKRQQNRLLRKLKMTMDELSSRVGLQAVVVVATPGSVKGNYKVFGSNPLEEVVRGLKDEVLEGLEAALEVQAPEKTKPDPMLYELPELIVDGIPTPVEKMTQAQLRTFIPLMMKYSTGRGKPGWNRESAKPPWWPPNVPWANVRIDARSTDVKHSNSWTETLRQIVISCYKYHGREDLLNVYDSSANKEQVAEPSVQTFTTTDGAIYQISSDQIITIPEEHLDLITQQEQGNQQIIFTSEDGSTYPVAVSGIITVPMTTPVYQAFVPANVSPVELIEQ